MDITQIFQFLALFPETTAVPRQRLSDVYVTLKEKLLSPSRYR
jgi:hypothetical protein